MQITTSGSHGLQAGDVVFINGHRGRVTLGDAVTFEVERVLPWYLKILRWWAFKALPTIWSWNPCNGVKA